MKNTIISFFITLCIIMISCTNDQNNNKKNIISIASAIGNGEILKLSDYAKSIKYVQLKTDSNSLIDEIRQVIVENNYIYILDKSKLCKIFDLDGNFIHSVGRIGQGPGEYVHLRAIDVSPISKHIFFEANKIFEYDTNFIRIINEPQFDNGHSRWGTINLSSDIFISNIVKYGNNNYSFFIYNSNGEILKLLPNYEHVNKHNMSGYSTHETGIMYRINDGVRFYKPLSDTIYTITKNIEIEKSFIFDYGKYKFPLDMLKWRDESRNYIHLTNLYESTDYIFLNLMMGKHAPEAFSYEWKDPDGNIRERVNEMVYAVYNKKSGKLNLLNQPKKKELGFLNNLDNGFVIWPQYITSNNEIISYCQPDDFTAIYKRIKSPCKEMSNIAKKLSMEDNPIIMITTLK